MLTGDLTAEDSSPVAGPPRRGPARRIAVVVVVTAVVVALIRSLVVQSFVVPTASMTPTVRPGDRVLVSRLSQLTGGVGNGDLHRGDVVVFDGAGVFEAPNAPARSSLASIGRTVTSALGLPIGSSDYVKRVIGLPGERVVCCDKQGRITVDGVALDESYVQPGDVPSTVRFDVVVPPGRLWVMGDHRGDSADSRAHLGDPGGGTVPFSHVVGRVVGTYWPPSRAGGLGSSGLGPAKAAR